MLCFLRTEYVKGIERAPKIIEVIENKEAIISP